MGHRGLPMVGREAEFEQVAAMLGGVAEGAGGILLVEGEPGIGKSSLVQGLVERAAHAGMVVFSARAEELEQRRPFGLISDCLETAVAEPLRRELAHLLRERVPLEAEGRDALSTPPTVDFRYGQAWLELFEQLAVRGPVVVAFDDLHWADASSLMVLGRLGRMTFGLPVLLAGTFRPLPRTPELTAAISALEGHGAVTLRLAPLTESAVSTLTQCLVQGRPGTRLMQQVGQAGGNPFLVTELVEALAADGLLAADVAGVVEVATVAVPVSLRLTVLRRLSFLSTQTLDVLRVASVLGTRFGTAALGAVSGASQILLVSSIREALDGSVLVEEHQDLRFRHDLLREALYQDLPAALRASLHRDAARHFASIGAPASQVAEHVLRYAGPHDAEALQWLWESAAELAAVTPATAAEILDRALLVADQSHPQRDRILAARALSLQWAGQLDEAEAICRGALARPHDPATEGLFHMCLARGLLARGRGAEALQAAELAQADPSLSTVERARLLAWSSTALISVGLVGQATMRAEQAQRAAVTCGDPLAECIAVTTLATAANFGGRLEEAVVLAEAAVRIADRSPDGAAHRFHVNFYRAVLLIDVDRLQDAHEAVRVGRALSDELGTRSSQPPYQWTTALAHYLGGNWDDAIAECEACVDLADDLGVRQGVLLAHALRSLIALHRNQLGVAAAAATSAEDELRATGDQYGLEHWVALARALVLEAHGDVDAAYLTLHDAWQRSSSAGLVTYYPDLGPDLARLAVATSRGNEVTAVAQAIAALAARNPGVPRLAAEAAFCHGLVEGGVEQLVQAADALRESARPLARARCCEAAGDALVAADHIESAAAWYDDALSAYEWLGAERDLARVDAALRALGRRRGRRGRRARPASGWGSLTTTEQTVARLAADGLSNTEIADRMFISRHTVHTHMGHILAKLGLRSRVQLAAELAVRNAPFGFELP